MEELVREAKQGNREAFTTLILEMRHRLYKMARTRLVCNDDIEDSIQETMIEAFNHISSLKEERYFTSWIIKILINKCNKIYRKRKQNNISFEDLDLEKYGIDETGPNVESDMAFQSLLSLLNYKERIAIMLYYEEEYTTKEISKILRISENTVKSRIRRAKEKIKDSIKGGN